MNREDLTFAVGHDRCAAWLYRPEDATGDVPCVVMAHGFSLTRHDGLPRFAEAFAAAGVATLLFDHRHLGDSVTATPQRLRMPEQRADWRAAVAFARSQPGVDADRVVLWGYSMSGGHAVHTALADPRVIGALVLCPFVAGLERALATPPKVTARILPLAVADRLGRHVRIPVTAPDGGFAAMSLPGECDGFHRAVPDNSPWRNEIGPGLFADIVAHRPVAKAAKLRIPLWVGLGDRDVSVAEKAVVRLAARAPRGQLHRYDADHFDVLVGGTADRIAADQVAFLRGVLGA